MRRRKRGRRTLGRARRLILAFLVVASLGCLLTLEAASEVREPVPPLQRKINFTAFRKRQTPTPPGWEPYDGSVYTPERGYGWLTDLRQHGWDGGGTGHMILPDGTRASPLALSRLELANWQGTHPENRPQVFRIDLPDGWYRVTCTSVDPDNAPLPLVDERSIKFRAHDVVFAGPRYGAPLAVEGNRLIEGSDVVEVTEGHLRIVVGDVAYGGWVWGYPGPFFQGWRAWWRKGRQYATTWFQVLTRTVDPGFHSLRFNSLEIEQVPAPARQAALVFRDYMNRDDHPDLNAGLPEHDRWVPSPFTSSGPTIQHDLFHTAIRLIGPTRGQGNLALTQRAQSPAMGTIRYATRVSLFTGEGSHIHRGSQEAGLLILADPAEASDASSVFVGIAFEAGHPEAPGWMKVRVGDGMGGFRTQLDIPDTLLPFRVTAGEYEIIIEHAVEENRLTRVCVNGTDVTDLIPPARRTPPRAQGAFGIRARMDAQDSGVRLQQFYWYYRVEEISNAQDSTPSDL